MVATPTMAGDVSTFTLPPADVVTPTSVGTYCFNASYSGDSNYLAVSTQSGAQCFTVTPATPVIAWTSPSRVTFGTPLGPTQLDAVAMVGGKALGQLQL